MLVFVSQRLVQSVFLMLVMSMILFMGIYQIGNPIDILISPEADQQEIARAIQSFGLDQPLWKQYLVYLGNLLQGDLGVSFAHNVPALELIFSRMPATLELAVAALLMAIVFGVPLGLLAGYHPDSILGRAIMAGSVLGFSLPTFWVGIILIMIFSVMLGWLPASGRGPTVTVLGMEWSFLTWDGLRSLFLPALNLALFKISLVIRLTRAGVREVLPMEYVRYARSRGLSSQRILWAHVLPNTLIPVVTVLGLEFGTLIAFSVVTETIFAWPGMGKLIIDSINLLDRPVIVAYLMMIVLIFIVINLFVDVVYSLLDPRVRVSEASE